MSLYVTGTVNMTNNSAAVVGVGTAFVANVTAGAGFLIQGETVYYTVLSITDDTHLTLSVVYAGTTGTGKTYQISRDWTVNLGLAEIQPGDPNWPYLLTQKVIRKIDAGVAPLASPVFTTLSATGSIHGNIASGIRAFVISGWTFANYSGDTLQIGNTQNGGEWTEIAHYIGAIKITSTTGAGLAVTGGLSATTQISTPKIVTASGNLEILPPGNADIVLQGSGTGKVGIGPTTPTAVLHLKAGTATANTAPLKFTAGTNLTTPESGVMEFDGTNLYITIGGVRKTIQVA